MDERRLAHSLRRHEALRVEQERYVEWVSSIGKARVIARQSELQLDALVRGIFAFVLSFSFGCPHFWSLR